jgi:hypothetical protein
MLMASSALGQMAEPPSAVAPPSRPAPISPLAQVEFTARAWYVFESFGQPIRRQNPLSFQTNNGDEFALGGGAVSARFTALPETTFILSGLYGTNDPAPAVNANSGGFTVTTHTERVDAEFLAQTAVPESGWAWIVGGRFERHDSTNKAFRTPPITSSDAINIYTFKGGVTGAVPLTPDGGLRLFGNAQIAAGGTTFQSATPGFGVVGPDLAMGVQYSLSPDFTIDARYRGMIYYLFNTARSLEVAGAPKYVVYQGPMIGLNVKF